MRRRELLLLVGAAITTARTLHAQQKATPVVGFLGSGSATAFAPFLAAFRQGLEQAGYVEGQNVTIEYRWAEGNFDRLPALAADLIGRKVDLILASGGIPSARAAKDATSTIPVVFTAVSDPVGRGLIISLARPGGNLTGFSIMAVELMPKRFELMSELVPQTTAMALLWNPTGEITEGMVRDMREMVRLKGVQLHVLKATTEDEIDAAFASLDQLHVGTLIVGDDPFLPAGASRLSAWYHAMAFRRSFRTALLPPIQSLGRRSPGVRSEAAAAPGNEFDFDVTLRETLVRMISKELLVEPSAVVRSAARRAEDGFRETGEEAASSVPQTP